MDAAAPLKLIDVDYQPAWMTWVGATISCLKVLGVDCDATDVAGYSGYAFCLSVHNTL